MTGPRVFLILPTLLLSLALPAPAEAQVKEIIEWINGLSGPGLVRTGPEISLVALDDRNHIALAALIALVVDDRGNPATDDADIGAFGVKGILESTLLGEGGPVELRSRLGVEIHRFWGEFDSFWAPSFPATASLHFPLNRWALRVGTGFNIFDFPDDAFAPFDTGVATEGFDAGWMLQLAVEYGDFSLFRRGAARR